ncbi:DUF167 family protein [Ferrovibrio sp. MS7]|uniref:DUF167 family protein n=1 Tax=Ferrovibrio plantarum TaxID=3119164 RepID=UPI0031351429
MEIGGGLRLLVRLTPKASRDGVLGLKPAAKGGVELAIGVTAVPEKGKANAALLRLLAKELGVAGRDLSLAAGETDRHKQVALDGDVTMWRARLDAWLAGFKMKD